MVRCVVLGALFTIGCVDDPKATDTGDTAVTDGGGVGCDPTGLILATDPNNYSYEADFTVRSTPIEAAVDATICWTDVTTDIRGRPLDPTDLYQISITRLSLTADEVPTAVVENTLTQDFVSDVRFVNLTGDFDDATCVQLTDFAILGNVFTPEFDLPEDPTTTWLASLWRFNDYGRNEILLSHIFEPLERSDNHLVELSDASSALGFDVDLDGVERLGACGDLPVYTFDWSAVTTDATGKAWDARANDTLLIGRVDGTVADAEAAFLQLYETADDIWTMSVYGLTQATLIDDGSIGAVDERDRPLVPRSLADEPFPGFTADGSTWLMGVECSTCTSPAPTFLGVVDVL